MAIGAAIDDRFARSESGHPRRGRAYSGNRSPGSFDFPWRIDAETVAIRDRRSCASRRWLRTVTQEQIVRLGCNSRLVPMRCSRGEHGKSRVEHAAGVILLLCTAKSIAERKCSSRFRRRTRLLQHADAWLRYRRCTARRRQTGPSADDSVCTGSGSGSGPSPSTPVPRNGGDDAGGQIDLADGLAFGVGDDQACCWGRASCPSARPGAPAIRRTWH